MNYLGNLKYAEGSRKKKKRIGRGQGSGRGGTSTKGHKGAQSRAGYKKKVGFEGGQMPLFRRIPKFGFTNINRVPYAPINLARLNELVEKGAITDGVVNPDVLYAHGVISKRNARIKILGVGEVSATLSVTAHAFSASAKEKIEAAGGAVQTLS